MASTATTRNRFNKQGTGDNTGTWGTVQNAQVFDLVDEALDGLTSLVVSGNVSLTSVNYATDQSRKRTLRLTGSPGASYTITIPSVEKFYWVINQSNAAQTIKAGGVGVSIPAGSMAPVICDGTDCFTPAQTVAAAIGTVVDFAGTVAPAGWLICSGQAVSRTTYAALFGVIGTTYGTGDGSTTFNVPDLRGRVIAGADNMGGVAAARLTGYVTASVGGSQTHTLAVSELPSHTHPGTTGVQSQDHVHSYTIRSGTTSVTTGGGGAVSDLWQGTTTTTTTGMSVSHTHSFTTDATGSGTAHNNIQPTMAMNKIIYAGV